MLLINSASTIEPSRQASNVLTHPVSISHLWPFLQDRIKHTIATHLLINPSHLLQIGSARSGGPHGWDCLGRPSAKTKNSTKRPEVSSLHLVMQLEYRNPPSRKTGQHRPRLSPCSQIRRTQVRPTIICCHLHRCRRRLRMPEDLHSLSLLTLPPILSTLKT